MCFVGVYYIDCKLWQRYLVAPSFGGTILWWHHPLVALSFGGTILWWHHPLVAPSFGGTILWWHHPLLAPSRIIPHHPASSPLCDSILVEIKCINVRRNTTVFLNC
jgi:hypothetical protein